MANKLKILLTLAATLAAPGVSAQTEVRMLTTWDARYAGQTAICERYAGMLEDASGGSIQVEVFGPETIPPLEQLEPVQNGLFQVLCTYPGFHSGTTTLMSGLDSVRPDAAAFRASGAAGIVAEHYAGLGLELLAIPLGHGAFFFLKNGLSEAGDLSGMQIRALPPQHPLIMGLGGTPVVLPPAAMFSALERGTVDGAVFPAAGAKGYGFAEVTDYFVETPTTFAHVILANAGFWDGLDAATQATFREQAILLEDEIPALYVQLNAAETEALTAAGSVLQELSPAAAEAALAGVIEGAWGFAATKAAEDSARLRQVVTDAGLLLE